ncbi:hypothetical protein [Sediminicola luteus]|uniref:Uncharacterized protein n=1 Tax=Sediminicola luteus TaxID=319238 RepID=A0ABV2TYD8_9FLAO
MELKYDTIFTVKDNSFKDLANINRLEKSQITQKYNIPSIGYFFHPKEGNN